MDSSLLGGKENSACRNEDVCRLQVGAIGEKSVPLIVSLWPLGGFCCALSHHATAHGHKTFVVTAQLTAIVVCR